MQASQLAKIVQAVLALIEPVILITSQFSNQLSIACFMFEASVRIYYPGKRFRKLVLSFPKKELFNCSVHSKLKLEMRF
jgi:hypothetical protein